MKIKFLFQIERDVQNENEKLDVIYCSCCIEHYVGTRLLDVHC